MKTRKQGNAIVLTVPTKFNIKPDQEYVAVKGELGSITYIPKIENIFENAQKKVLTCVLRIHSRKIDI